VTDEKSKGFSKLLKYIFSAVNSKSGTWVIYCQSSRFLSCIAFFNIGHATISKLFSSDIVLVHEKISILWREGMAPNDSGRSSKRPRVKFCREGISSQSLYTFSMKVLHLQTQTSSSNPQWKYSIFLDKLTSQFWKALILMTWNF
jgi:hypothetical protein